MEIDRDWVDYTNLALNATQTLQLSGIEENLDKLGHQQRQANDSLTMIATAATNRAQKSDIQKAYRDIIWKLTQRLEEDTRKFANDPAQLGRPAVWRNPGNYLAAHCAKRVEVLDQAARGVDVSPRGGRVLQNGLLGDGEAFAPATHVSLGPPAHLQHIEMRTIRGCDSQGARTGKAEEIISS
jgi:hypothetical protein